MRLVVYPDARVVVTAPVFFGVEAIQRFVEKHRAWLRRKVNETSGRTLVHIKRVEIEILKRRALTFASERCAHIAQRYGAQYKKITIRAQKSRWGSCSRAGNLSFNYKIAALPAHIADYIIVHEICHLIEMNHSKRFWALVAKTIPNHKELRKELRKIAVVYH